MNASHSNRPTDRLARLVAQVRTTGRSLTPVRSRRDGDVAGLVNITRRLNRLGSSVHTDPKFRRDLRATLMSTIERDGIGATARQPDPAHDVTAEISPAG